MNAEKRKSTAKRLLINYFRECMQAAGLNFDQDSRVEIGEITDLIFDEIADSRAAITQNVGTVEAGARVTGAKIDFLR